MYISYEYLLWLGIALFYIYDSIELVYFNDIYIVKGLKSWKYLIPNPFFTIFNKIVFIPNPLTPHCLFFKFSFPSNEAKISPKEGNNINTFNKAICNIQTLTLYQLILLGVVFPIMLINYSYGPLLLGIMALIYMNILTIFVLIYVNKKKFKISQKQFLTYLFESIFCPPFSLNILRKISKNYEIKNSPISFSTKKMNKKLVRNFRFEVNEVINTYLSISDNKEEFSKKLIKYKKYELR
jgi:hypothetical protein